MINLSNTTPAAPSGGTPVSWQQDASGNVSGYTAKVKLSVSAVSGVLTLDASQATSFFVPVTAAITSMSITNPPSDGTEITILYAQDSTGHAVALPTNMFGALTVNTTANKHTCQSFTYNVADDNWYAIGVAGM